MRTRLMNNVGLKVLAFLIASLLWLLVVNIDDPVTNKTYSNIPVTVMNQEILAADKDNPQTYQIVDDTQTVSVTVSAKRSILNKIKPEDITAVADMKEMILKSQIPIDVKVNGYAYENAYATPRNLQVKLEKEETKKFPIVPKTTGTVRDGYVLNEIQAEPEKVTILGPKSVIDKISRVEAVVSVSGLSEDAVLQSELVLYGEDNEVIDQKLLRNNLGAEGVGVRVELLHTKNIPLEFDTSEIETAEGYEFTGITFEPEELQISGTEEALEDVSMISIPSSALKMTGLDRKTEKIVDISEYLPEGLGLADKNAGSVVVTLAVERDGTKAYEVTTGYILVKGLADDLSLQYDSVDAMELQIRGPKAVLEKLDITKAVSVDLKTYTEPGTYDVPVKVELPEKCVLEKEVSVKVVLEKKE